MNAEVRAIRENEIPECLALWKTVFPEAFPGFFERYVFGDADYQPDYTRVAVLDGGIVSAVQIVKRTISCGDCALTLGGLGNVCSHPDYRGKGYALKCIQQAIQVMEADAFDVSLLFSGKHAFYAKCGYESVTASLLVGELRPEPLHPYTRMIVRPYEDRDDAAIHLIHVMFNRERPLTVRRSPAYWRDWIGWYQGQAPGRATVAEHEGVVVGYCLYAVNEENGCIVVRELGVRDGGEQAIDALLEEAADVARAHHIPAMVIPLHEELAIEEVSTRLFVNKKLELKNNAMIRFLHRDNVLRGLSPLLTDRWRRCGSPEGSLTFTGPYGSTTILSAGPFLRIEETEPDETALRQADLLQLLVGRELPKDRLPNTDMRFANALFPPHDPWFWELDGF